MISSLINDPFGTLMQILYMLPGLIIGFTLHEWAHAFAAVKMGDDTPRLDGRLTLNPLAHIDWLGLSLFVLLGFGWARPVRTRPYSYRNNKAGKIVVSFAGVAANLVLCFIFALLYLLSIRTGAQVIISICLYGMSVNASLFALNLLPVPPLDGSKILMALFPRGLQTWMTFERYGYVILFALSIFGVLAAYIGIVSGFIFGGAINFWSLFIR